MPYFITGTLTFASQANRNTAQTALNAVPHGNAVAWTGKYPAGIATSGSTVLTVSFSVPTDAEARTFTRALFNSYATLVRNSGHLAVALVD